MSESSSSSSDSSSEQVLDINADLMDQNEMNEPTALDYRFNEVKGEMPWRKCTKRAELEEYFNYGFDEITFRMYQILYKQEQERRAGRK